VTAFSFVRQPLQLHLPRLRPELVLGWCSNPYVGALSADFCHPPACDRACPARLSFFTVFIVPWTPPLYAVYQGGVYEVW